LVCSAIVLYKRCNKIKRAAFLEQGETMQENSQGGASRLKQIKLNYYNSVFKIKRYVALISQRFISKAVFLKLKVSDLKTFQVE